MHAMMDQMPGMTSGRGMGPWVLVVVLLLVVLVVAVVVVAARASSAGRTDRADALRELERRYARGDVEREDFLQRRADLGGR